MTIDEAIKILGDKAGLGNWYDDDELVAAIHLGMHALKRIKEGRDRGYDYFGHLLPGEIKE